MKIFKTMLTAMLTTALVFGIANTSSFAGPWKKKGVPPGLAKKKGVPPGLAKKGGLPPGIAKKYKVGESLPGSAYVPIESRYRDRLPYGSPEGRKWVRVGRDLYLMTAATGVVVDVVENWLDQ